MPLTATDSRRCYPAHHNTQPRGRGERLAPRADFILARSPRAPTRGRRYDCSPTLVEDVVSRYLREESRYDWLDDAQVGLCEREVGEHKAATLRGLTDHPNHAAQGSPALRVPME